MYTYKLISKLHAKIASGAKIPPCPTDKRWPFSGPQKLPLRRFCSSWPGLDPFTLNKILSTGTLGVVTDERLTAPQRGWATLKERGGRHAAHVRRRATRKWPGPYRVGAGSLLKTEKLRESAPPFPRLCFLISAAFYKPRPNPYSPQTLDVNAQQVVLFESGATERCLTFCAANCSAATGTIERSTAGRPLLPRRFREPSSCLAREKSRSLNRWNL